MSVSKIRKLIEEQASEFSRISSDMSSRLQSLERSIHGHLSVRNDNGQFRYFERTNSTKGNGEYLGHDKIETIRLLELKEYCSLLKKTADEGSRKLDRIRKILCELPDTEKVFESISEEKRHLIEPFIHGVSEDQIESWKSDFMAHRNVKSDNEYFTAGGVRVRSKSELIIAGRFEGKGIPYKYEAPIFIGEWSDVWFPDFTVLNKRTGEEFYWEHYGIMDNPEYCASTIFKLEQYAKKGIIHGKNLIVTMESSGHPLNTKYVDTLIESYLI